MYIKGQLSSFNYMGGKYSILPWLLDKLPESKHFVDVCGGSGVVLLNRKPSPIETYNDINGKLVNFFKVLREQPDNLISALELTPHSRQEYLSAWYSEHDSDLESARKFFVRSVQSLWAAGAQDKMKGWAMSVNESRVSISEKTHKWIRAIENLKTIYERIRTVQIECRDFRKVLTTYDSANTLFYIDSPYDQTFRSHTKYEFDFRNRDFVDLRNLCIKIEGKVAISGYNSDIMMDLFSDFTFHMGPQSKNNRRKIPVNECLWTNY